MSKDNKAKSSSFMKGAAILSIAGVIVKILGAIYRIPMGNLIGSEGLGYYQTAYPFYTLLLTVSTTGIPIAIAKLVSERRAKEDYSGAYKVFRVSLALLTVIGILTSLFVFFRADNIVNSLGNRNAYYALVALVPALLFTPMMSAFRGYFQGSQNMKPTAISQIGEQLFRVMGGLYLAYYFMNIGVSEAAGGASFGGSIGAFVGLIVIVLIFFYNKKSIMEEVDSTKIQTEYSSREIIRDLVVIAVPITIGGAIAPIMDSIDTKLVLSRLQSINYTEAAANELFGQLKGYAQTLINLPQVFSIAIGMSLVPAIAEASARQQQDKIDKTVGTGIRITLLIGLPCAIGLFVLAEPIIGLLYYKNTPEVIASTGEILRYLSLGVVFLTLVQTQTSIIQGLGKPMIPVINLFIGAVVKVILTYTLTVIPSINIKGAAISTVAAYAIAALLDLLVLIKVFGIKLNFKNIMLKPLISAVGMGIIVQLSFSLLTKGLGQNISTLLAIAVGGITYILLLFITGSITNEDLLLLPKGDKIVAKIDRKGTENE